EAATHFEQPPAFQRQAGTTDEVFKRLDGLLAARVEQILAKPALGGAVLRPDLVAIEGGERLVIASRGDVDETAAAARHRPHALAPAAMTRQHARVIGAAEIARNVDETGGRQSTADHTRALRTRSSA